MKISVVIPVYGCPDALPELYKRLTNVLQKIAKDSYEIILVNDACPKNSWNTIKQICIQDNHVIGLEFSRNFGQMKAILAGLDFSNGQWVVVMDCDLQDQPEEIMRLYERAVTDGYDVVFARRIARQDSKFKVYLSKLFYKLYSWATDIEYDPTLCNFSISHRKVIKAYCKMRELHRAFVMYIQWLGFRIGTLDVQHHERYSGKSSYTLKKRINEALGILLSQSDKLLRLLFVSGFLISALSLLAFIIIVIRHFTVHSPAGWGSLIAVSFLTCGVVMASLGIIGAYIGNIFLQVKQRPLYVIRTALNSHTESHLEEKQKEAD